jgi:hypothetical protein
MPNDHPPAHVHVTNTDGAMKVNLGEEKSGPTIHSIHGMKDSDARAAFLIVLANKSRLPGEMEEMAWVTRSPKTN